VTVSSEVPGVKDDVSAAESAASAPESVPAAQPRRGRWADLLAILAYFAFSGYVTAEFWADPDRREPVFLDGGDAMLTQWFLAHSAHAVAHWENPFFSTALGAPEGVDIAGQASVLLLGLVLAPLTLLAGVGVTTCVVITGCVVGTAAAWYWLLSRPLGLHRGAAFVAGLMCATASTVAADAVDGHPHVGAQFLVPLIIWRVVLVARAERPLRDGLLLGLLVTAQALIGEEVLLITAMAVVLFLAAYAVRQWRQARAAVLALLRGGTVAVLTAGLLLAVPLWYQFAGPQHFTENPQSPLPGGRTVLDFVGLPVNTLWWSTAGDWGMAAPVLGLPIVLTLLLFGWPLRRSVVFTGAMAVAVVMGVLSMSVDVHLRHRVLPGAGPWRLFAYLPVFQWVIPNRLALIVIPAVAVGLAMIIDRALTRWAQGARWQPAIAVVMAVAAVTFTVPDRSRYATITFPAAPQFVTSGSWQRYVPPGRTLVTVPAPSLQSFDGMRWANASHADIPIPGGYFLAVSPDGKSTTFGPPPRWTTQMWNTVDSTGQVWQVQPGDRERLLADLRYWKAGVVVLVPTRRHVTALRDSVEKLLGPPQQVDDVLLWDVHTLT
jgi:hypothetical protein